MHSKKVLISSNYAWTIFNFRMNLIRRLKKEGFEVIVLTQFDGYEKNIKKEVDEIKPLFISRKGINPFVDLITFFNYIKTILSYKPCAVLLFTVKPVIYGSLAARLTKTSSIPMITGLGTAFIKQSWLTRLIKYLYKFSLKASGTIFFQNNDDKDLFIENKIVKSEFCKITPGSGVDLQKFKQTDIPKKKKLVFLFVGRMLKDKGVREYVDAAKIIKKKYSNISFQLLGPIGSKNRTAISPEKIKNWHDKKIIEYLGETDDIVNFLNDATCVVLPSYREGTSRALLEAAAVGRPIITSDVPGCREIIDDCKSGFLCKARDPLDLADKMEKMISLSHESRVNMGNKGRLKVQKEYSEEIVLNYFIDVIKETS
tara:strand:- start:355 stop:1467 length:1113 start_codon:yes stop_codon:yes gene_type:complete